MLKSNITTGHTLKGDFMKNIRLVLLGELILFAVVFLFNVAMGTGGLEAVRWFIDIPALLVIIMILIPGMMIKGVWKDFLKSFSVGIKPYRLLELKNIIGAVDAAQKLTVYGALIAIIVSGVIVMGKLSEPSTIGPSLAVCFLSAFYAVIIELFLLPLKLNAERKMNEEMDLGDE